MLSFRELDKITSDLREKGYNSYSDFDKLNDDKVLSPLIDNGILTNLLKQDITELLDLLFTNYPFYYKKKMSLHYLSEMDIYSRYALSLYAGSNKAYNNFPYLLYLLIDKLNIEKYKYLDKNTLASIVYQNYDVDNYYDYKHECEANRINEKKRNDIYNKYDDNYNPNIAPALDTEEFYIWAEHRSFDDVYSSNSKKENVIWVSRDYGDGYGFDIYCQSSFSDKEILIEVKSGKYNDFTLTKNEYRVMKTCYLHNAEYYIHKYTYNKVDNKVESMDYHYDPELDLLVDTNGEYYRLQPCEYIDDYGRTSYGYSPIRKELEKTKTLS